MDLRKFFYHMNLLLDSIIKKGKIVKIKNDSMRKLF